MLGRAIKTHSHPTGRRSASLRKSSRANRFARFRFTAKGMLFLATTTANLALVSGDRACPRFKRKGPQSSREPFWRRREKSAEARIRRSRGRRIRLRCAEALTTNLATIGENFATTRGLRTSTETALTGTGNLGWTVGGMHKFRCITQIDPTNSVKPHTSLLGR